MLRRQGSHSGHREGELEVEGLLRPERAVVVEGRDALLGRYVLRARAIGNLLDKRDDALLCRSVVPGWQGVGLRPERGGREQQNETENKPDCASPRGHGETLPIAHSCGNSDLGRMTPFATGCR